MKVYDSNNIRSIAILGHSGCGKTNLIEAMAYTSKTTNKMPKLTDKISMTYSMNLVPIEYRDYKLNLLDTPGYSDFTGDVISAISASDAAVIVIDATTSIQVGTEKALELAGESIPKLIFINKIDNDKSRYKDLIEELRDKYSNKIVPMYMPIYNGEEFIKLHNIFESDSDLCDEFKIQVEGTRDGLLELIAETDDELLEKYFSGEDLTEEDIKRGTTIGIQNGDIIPVICASTINNVGTEEILGIISSYIQPKCVYENDKLNGSIFKTIVDPFIGKMSYVKILQGNIKRYRSI